MKFIHVSDQEWNDLKHALTEGNHSPGAFLVSGPSDLIATQARSIVEYSFRRDDSTRYFLCSAQTFHVPCYVPFESRDIEPEPVDAAHLFVKRFTPGQTATQHVESEVISDLLQATCNREQSPLRIFIECLIAPAQTDLSFILSVLKSALPQHALIVIFAHQPNSEYTRQPAFDEGGAPAEMLATLYLCGGRVQAAAWSRIVGGDQLNGCCEKLIALRHVGAETLLCYANREVAELAETIFQTLEQTKRRELAQKVLRSLAFNKGYSSLEIAAETGELRTMLLSYSPQLLDTALLEPDELATYYRCLQEAAQKENQYALTDVAQISYFVTLLYSSRKHAIHIYETLQGKFPGTIDKKIEWLFWNELGQNLVILDQKELWEYAAHSFYLSRQSLKSAEDISLEEIRWGTAMNANGEALLAYKQQQGEKACWLVECALTELQDIASSLYFRVHIRTNLGDVFLRTLGDVNGAIAQYEQAILTLSQAPRKLNRQMGPKRVRLFRHRSALKLGTALIHAERYEEAIQILTNLLHYLERSSSEDGEKGAQLVLKTREALAMAHLKAGHLRHAAACYWHILHHPEWLEQTTLIEVANKLRSSRPDIHERLQRSIDRVVSVQEARMAALKRAQQVLTSIA
ncbi:MAG TPA: hypothetical protein VFB60_26740 [Ktedonobacteraceae bacterium]|nr:hypothetical protein [Ktedonobacteraceae bacterium]